MLYIGRQLSSKRKYKSPWGSVHRAPTEQGRNTLQLHTMANNITWCLWLGHSNSSCVVCSVQLRLPDTALIRPTHAQDQTNSPFHIRLCLLGDVKTDSIHFSQYQKPTGWDSWNHRGFSLQRDFSTALSSRSSVAFTRCGHKLCLKPFREAGY